MLILPYRPPLPTAKAVATVQELSGGRLRLGVGVGWMKPEFRALGVPRSERGRRSDEVLDFLGRCFAGDEVEANGQPFLFKPRPAKPPIYVGGAAPHAFVRAARHADGWMPMGGDPESLAGSIGELREHFAAAGRGDPEVICLNGLPIADGEGAMRDRLGAFEAAGVTTFVQAVRYDDESGYRRTVDGLAPVLA